MSCKTIPLDPLSNMATFTLAPSYAKYDAFCLEAEVCDDDDFTSPCCIKCDAVEIVTDDEDDEAPDEATERVTPRETTFDLDSPKHRVSTPVIIEDEEDLQRTNTSAEFLRYHHKFNHASPKRIQRLAQMGVIPR
jgi:hypothetical protein